MHSGNYYLIEIRAIWRNSSHDWSMLMDGYNLFRKDRQAGETKEEIRGENIREDVMVSIYYRPPTQEKEVDWPSVNNC